MSHVNGVGIYVDETVLFYFRVNNTNCIIVEKLLVFCLTASYAPLHI